MPEPEARESAEVAAGGVGIVLALFLLGVGLSALGLHRVYRWLAPGDSFVPPATFAPPPLLTNADSARDPAAAAQRAALEDYRWTDRDHGLVQAPIERAMAWVAARGADGYAPPPDPRASP